MTDDEIFDRLRDLHKFYGHDFVEVVINRLKSKDIALQKRRKLAQIDKERVRRYDQALWRLDALICEHVPVLGAKSAQILTEARQK